uniref:BTB domain-containing protein n=1 Tax=Panagrellus redivivus TaxID=6233 RepID=A0A7E4UUI3_PANRE
MASTMSTDNEQISDLYLDEKLSDVTIVIGNVEIPAHRDILVRRCRYFEAMFDSGMIESTSNRIELHETQIDGFKSVLKWIYTGTVQLTVIDDAFEILCLARMYELPKLVNVVVDFLKNICVLDNVCTILNEAVLLSLDELTDFVIKFVSDKSFEVLKHESFKQLSPDALNEILTRVVFPAADIDIFHTVVGWMKANPSNSAGFSNILKKVALDSITVKDMAALPSDVLDAVVHLIRKNETVGPTYCLKNENIAVLKYGVKVIAGGDASFFDENVKGVLKHSIESSKEFIVIDLEHRFLLNSFKILLTGNEKKTYSYCIDVSEDNVNWIRVIDHSKYLCRSLQNLYFKPRPVRFIRICGTAPVDGILKLSIFKASYTTEKFDIDPETTLVIPSDNLALTDRGAILVQGVTNAIINGKFQGYTHFSGYTRHNIGEPGIIVQLPQPYLVDAMKLRLWDHDDRVYSYNIEVSVDQINWTRVFSEERVSSWREVRFQKQPVVFIKVTGTYNSANTSFQCVHLECFASKNNSIVE